MKKMHLIFLNFVTIQVVHCTEKAEDKEINIEKPKKSFTPDGTEPQETGITRCIGPDSENITKPSFTPDGTKSQETDITKPMINITKPMINITKRKKRVNAPSYDQISLSHDESTHWTDTQEPSSFEMQDSFVSYFYLSLFFLCSNNQGSAVDSVKQTAQLHKDSPKVKKEEEKISFNSQMNYLASLMENLSTEIEKKIAQLHKDSSKVKKEEEKIFFNSQIKCLASLTENSSIEIAKKTIFTENFINIQNNYKDFIFSTPSLLNEEQCAEFLCRKLNDPKYKTLKKKIKSAFPNEKRICLGEVLERIGKNDIIHELIDAYKGFGYVFKFINNIQPVDLF